MKRNIALGIAGFALLIAALEFAARHGSFIPWFSDRGICGTKWTWWLAGMLVAFLPVAGVASLLLSRKKLVQAIAWIGILPAVILGAGIYFKIFIPKMESAELLGIDRRIFTVTGTYRGLENELVTVFSSKTKEGDVYDFTTQDLENPDEITDLNVGSEIILITDGGTHKPRLINLQKP